MISPPKQRKKIDLEKYQNNLLRALIHIFFGTVVVLSIMELFRESSYNYIIIPTIIFSSALEILIFFKSLKLAKILFTVIFPIQFYIQGYFQESAYVMCILGVLLLVTAFLLDFKFATLQFISHLIVITIYVAIGKLTIVAEIDPITGNGYVNNITVLVPVLFASWIIAYIISKVLLHTIKIQQEQYDLLLNTQQKLIEQEKIQSIQVLAGGIAHDFNNLLTVITGNLSLLQIEEPLTENQEDLLQPMEKAVKQASLLNLELLNFSKSSNEESREFIQIHDLIKNVAQFSLHGRKSMVEFSFTTENIVVNGNAIQLGQVFQNLLINADEAMETAGIIEISSEVLNLPQGNGFGLEEGDFVKISIKDSGNGIRPEDTSKLFHLFFTTKAKGNGIGLSVSLSIVQNHQGIIQFESIYGTGTTFEVFLPIHSNNAYNTFII